MKIRIETDGKKTRKISIPQWLYTNSLGISLLALNKNVNITPKQARKAVKAVKKVVKEKKASFVAEIEIVEEDSKVSILI